MKLTKRQLMNILIEEVGLSDGQVKRINLKRQFFPAVERLIDKAVGRIDDEIDPYEPLTKVDILDELVPYLGGLNRQLSGFNESKITRKQLRRLMMEVVVASDDVKQKASDLEDSLKTDNPDASDEEIEAAIDKLTEKLEKLPSYAYYDYGIDHVPNKTDAHEDIIGHT